MPDLSPSVGEGPTRRGEAVCLRLALQMISTAGFRIERKPYDPELRDQEEFSPVGLQSALFSSLSFSSQWPPPNVGIGNRTILFVVQSLDRDAKWEYEISKDRGL